MEDKTFVLIEKLYIEMQGMRSELGAEIQGVRSEMATKSDLARMEHENSEKFRALFDGLSGNTEAIQELKTEIQALKKEVENHEIKLKLVK